LVETVLEVFAIAHHTVGAAPEEFAPPLADEANHALGLYRDDIVHEIYSRSDGNGAVVVLECDDVTQAEGIRADLPLARAGLLSFDVYGVGPYRPAR
jgi:hypothetical protein